MSRRRNCSPVVENPQIIVEAIERYDFQTALRLLESSKLSKTWAKQHLSLHPIVSVCFEKSRDVIAVHQVLPLMDKILQLHPDALYEKNNYGRLPLYSTLEYCRHEDCSWNIVHYLVTKYPESLFIDCPLHMLVKRDFQTDTNQVVKDILGKLASKYPDSFKCQDEHGDLPIHDYVRCGTYSKDVLEKIVKAHPQGLRHRNDAGHTPLQGAETLNFMKKQSTALEIEKDQLKETLNKMEMDHKKLENDHKNEASIQQSKFNRQKKVVLDLRRKNKDLKHELDQHQADQADQSSSLEKSLDKFRKENNDLKDEQQKLRHSLNVYKAIEAETTKTEQCFLEILEENESMTACSIEQLKIIATSVKERLDIVKKEADGPPTKSSLVEVVFLPCINSPEVSKECLVRLIHDLHEELSKTQKACFEHQGGRRAAREAGPTAAISNNTEQSEGTVTAEETEATTTTTATFADNSSPKESSDPSAKRRRISVSPTQL